MSLNTFMNYKVGQTPMYRATSYCHSGNLYIKREDRNAHGSIKERAAYYIIRDLIEGDKIGKSTKLVESSSGNLGLSLGYFAREIGIDFLCLVDPTLPPEKLELLVENKIQIHSVALGSHSNYRDARIQMAHELDQQSDWIWTRQYSNPSNVRAHYESTGPEIWTQLDNHVDYVVCSVGSGGTISGVGRYIKQKCPTVSIIAVEPTGSTIFGGIPGCYLSVGAGMSYTPEIIETYGDVIDYCCHVDDKDALRECVRFFHTESFQVGVTTGSVLVVALQIALNNPTKRIVAIAADGGEKYASLFLDVGSDATANSDVRLQKYHLD